MSLLRFELRAQGKTACLWALTILAMLFLLMQGVYPVFEASFENVIAVINGYPPEFAMAFAFDITTMFNLGGFYSFSFTYISLMGAMMALSMGLSAFSREKRAKCVDFLLTKPMSRARIFLYKLLPSFGLLALANVLYVFACFSILANDITDFAIVFGAAIALLPTQLVFFSIAIFYAVFAKKVRSVTSVSTALSFGAFILSALVNIFHEDALRWIAPLKYFDPTALFTQGSFEMPYAWAGIFVALLALGFAFVRFCKSDAHVA